MSRLALLLALSPLAAVTDCLKKDDKLYLERFNASSDHFTLEIGDAVADTGSFKQELFSTTGKLAIGHVAVDPHGGPVGTNHRITVEVSDDFQKKVLLAEIVVDSGERGAETFTLDQDSADKGVWVVELTSFGAPGEERSDVVEVVLWQRSAVQDEEIVTTDE